MRYSCNPTLRVSRLGYQGKRVRGSWRIGAQQCLNQWSLFEETSSSGSDSQSNVGKINLKRKKHVVLDKPVKNQKPGELGLLPSRVVAADIIPYRKLRKQGTSVFRTLQEKS